MNPRKIDEEIARRRREIFALQTKRKAAEAGEDYKQSSQAQAKIAELGKQIDLLIAQGNKE